MYIDYLNIEKKKTVTIVRIWLANMYMKHYVVGSAHSIYKNTGNSVTFRIKMIIRASQTCNLNKLTVKNKKLIHKKKKSQHCID